MLIIYNESTFYLAYFAEICADMSRCTQANDKKMHSVDTGIQYSAHTWSNPDSHTRYCTVLYLYLFEMDCTMFMKDRYCILEDDNEWMTYREETFPMQGLKLTLIPRSDFLLLLLKSWSKSDHHRSYVLSLKPDIWLDWVAKLCS